MAEFIGVAISWFIDLFNLFLNIQVDEFMGQPITFSALLLLGVALGVIMLVFIRDVKEFRGKNSSDNKK